jgi:hypothetical protein
MQFLGESFNAKNCHAMCDNCLVGYKIYDKNMNKEALTILQLVEKANYMKCTVTTKQTLDLLRGNRLKKNHVDVAMMD